MWHAVELPDAEHVRLVLDHRRLVVIYVEVVRRREEGHDARGSRLAALAVHPVPMHQFVPTWTSGSRFRRTQNPAPHVHG